jgi:hypothetical protein
MMTRRDVTKGMAAAATAVMLPHAARAASVPRAQNIVMVPGLTKRRARSGVTNAM